MGEPDYGHPWRPCPRHRASLRRVNDEGSCGPAREFHLDGDVAQYHWPGCVPVGGLVHPAV